MRERFVVRKFFEHSFSFYDGERISAGETGKPKESIATLQSKTISGV